jgi:hypothetical protein
MPQPARAGGALQGAPFLLNLPRAESFPPWAKF